MGRGYVQEYPGTRAAAIDPAPALPPPRPRKAMTVRCELFAGMAAVGVLVGCYTGTPVAPPGRPPAPVQEYWGSPAAQLAFDRISRDLTLLEIQLVEATARSAPTDPAVVRLAASRDAARRELVALPNPQMAEIVVAERLDGALDRRLRELAVEQRLLLARVKPEEPEGRRMAATVAAVSARRDALHVRQDSLHARYQAEPTLSAGEWIRITLPPGVGRGARRAQGRLLELHQDSLLWQTGGAGPRALLLPKEATIERVVSRRGHAWEGAMLGLVGAAVIGGIKRGPFDDEAGIRTILFAPAGAVLGGVIGSMIYTERWAPVVRYRSATSTSAAGTVIGLRWALPPLDRGR